jgi:hypothetical protein
MSSVRNLFRKTPGQISLDQRAVVVRKSAMRFVVKPSLLLKISLNGVQTKKIFQIVERNCKEILLMVILSA